MRYLILIFIVIVFSCTNSEKKEIQSLKIFHDTQDTFTYTVFSEQKKINGDVYTNRLLVLNISNMDTIIYNYILINKEGIICYDERLNEKSILFCYNLKKKVPHHDSFSHNNMRESVSIISNDTIFSSLHISLRYAIVYEFKYNTKEIISITRVKTNGLVY